MSFPVNPSIKSQNYLHWDLLQPNARGLSKFENAQYSLLFLIAVYVVLSKYTILVYYVLINEYELLFDWLYDKNKTNYAKLIHIYGVFSEIY